MEVWRHAGEWAASQLSGCFPTGAGGSCQETGPPPRSPLSMRLLHEEKGFPDRRDSLPNLVNKGRLVQGFYPLWNKGQAHRNIPGERLHELSSKNTRMEPFTASSWTVSGPQESSPLISIQTLKLPLNLRLLGQESYK